MKTLIIAEKPSVATDLARVLGKIKKNGDYYENDEYIISSAVGHLVELFMPDDIDPKLKRWTLKNLPIIPSKFELKPIEKNPNAKKKFLELKKLLKEDEVELVVNACDAGREGELIFTYIYELAKCKKPVKRLWMMSMTPEAILESFRNLKEQTEMLPLQQAARCRSESDWLIGINGTRAITSRMYGSKGGQVATVGRVQTPTLAMVVEREYEIRNFISKPYWRIRADLGIKSGTYQAIFQKPNFKKGREDQEELDRIDRIWEEEVAQRILAEISKLSHAEVTDEKKRSTNVAPRLYDLTTLQREANNRFGLPAGKTLQIAQSLYEKHKMLTYPRTDSKALPQDYGPTCRQVLSALPGEYGKHADKVLQNDWINLGNRRVFDNKQVRDHFAIIPTTITDGKLSPDEEKIYDMVTRRFIAVFYPAAEYDVTTRTSMLGEHVFRTQGKVLVVPGWLAVTGKESNEETLPPLSPADGNPAKAKKLDVELLAEMTKPPPRYTEATLLAAMEGAGKLIEDEDLADAMKDKGLGTPATRAQTIDHLILSKYMDRQQRELIPTTKAENIIEFLKHIKLELLTNPTMTGEWEYKLHQIEEGKLSRDDFMKGITQVTTEVVDKTKAFTESEETATPTDIICPTDGKPLLENFRSYRSHDEKLTIYKTIGNRRLEKEEIRTLLAVGKIGPLDGFRSKMGKPFSAMLRIDEENKVKFVFENSGGEGEGGDGGSTNLADFPVVAQCPKTGADIHETSSAYVWNTPADKGKPTRISKTILAKTIVREQFLKMLNTGKTDLLEGFKSKRTGRFFAAHLCLRDGGKIGFEFAPRGEKKAGGKAKGGKGSKAEKAPLDDAPSEEQAAKN